MKVKICGITHPEDALHAAKCGADYIGIIFAKTSKRCVTPEQAVAIAKAAREGGAEPVGVFVDAGSDVIKAVCKRAKISTVQLYGESEYPEGLGQLYVVDGENPGSGKTFNWKKFSPPQDIRWMLAGGLNPDNVAAAIRLLKPYGVDVASGVEKPGSTRKDPQLVAAFIQNAKEKI